MSTPDPDGSFEKLLEAAPIAFFLVDEEGTILGVNEQAEQLLGYGRRELVGRSYEDLAEGAEHQDLDAIRRDLLATREGRPIGSGVRATAIRSDGSSLPVEAAVSVVEGEGGLRLLAAVRDLSSEVERERELRALEIRLRRATGAEAIDAQLGQSGRLETVGQLAGGIAHDFNNILGVIINYSQFVIDGLEEGSPARADVEEIWKAAKRGAALTRQLTMFSRHEPQTLEALDLNEAVSELEALLKRTLGEHVELTTSLEPRPWPIEADRGQIEQTLVNLALNARDAMPDGGELTITTANVELDEREAMLHPNVEPGPFVRLTVEDTGIGMDGEVAARAFEPFYTTKAQGEGTGLGLAIVYGIVTGAGGTVTLFSEPGVGTSVSAHFPASTAPAVSRDDEAPARLESGDASVLIVEDDPSMRRMAERILGRAGYRVTASAGGREALRKLESGAEIDLLLTDVVMPEMSGTELASRAAALHPGLRILLMSGYVDRPGVGPVEEDAVLLEKPFRAEDLLARVRDVLESAP